MNDKGRLRRHRRFFKFPSLIRSQKPIIGPSFAGTEKINGTESPEDDLDKKKDRLFIRKARSIDRAFVSSLGKQLFSLYGPYERAISQWFDHESTATFIAELDRVRVGFVMLGSLDQRFDMAPSFELLAIGLCRSARRSGIGNRLMETVEKYAVKQGLERIFLHTAVMNYPAQQLFYKRGYRPWGLKPQFYPAGQDAIVMTKKIQ